MDIGMVGLGKMGANMARRLRGGGHRVVVHDRSVAAVTALEREGMAGAESLAALVETLPAPRAVWLMVPAGEATQQAIDALAQRLAPGDLLIDGGNSHYRDSVARGKALGERGLHFVDCGTSGGLWGLTEGYCLMLGGEAAAVERLRPALEALAPAPDRGWARVGPSGAGHFVKMIHNGIEYGLMQAYAEGFELMARRPEFGLDLPAIAELWRHGSVVRSWLLDLAARALAENPALEGVAAWVPDSGEGRWTVQESVELSCPLPVITAALHSRFRSRSESPFADRLLAALRNQFGGHEVRKA